MKLVVTTTVLFLFTLSSYGGLSDIFKPRTYSTKDLKYCSNGELIINSKNQSLQLGQTIFFSKINGKIIIQKSLPNYPVCVTKIETTFNENQKYIIEKKEIICDDHSQNIISISRLEKIKGKIVFKSLEEFSSNSKKLKRKVQCVYQ